MESFANLKKLFRSSQSDRFDYLQADRSTELSLQGKALVNCNLLGKQFFVEDLFNIEDPAEKIKYSDCGRFLTVSISQTSGLMIDLCSRVRTQTFTIAKSHFQDPTVTPKATAVCAEYLAYSTGDDTVVVYHLPSVRTETIQTGSNTAVMAFSPCGRRLAVGDHIGVVVDIDLATKAIRRFPDHASVVTCVGYSSDGSLLGSSSFDSQVIIRCLAAPRNSLTFTGHKERVNGFAFSPCDQFVASASNDATVKVWETKTGTVRATHMPWKGHVSSVAFSPCGKFLAAAGRTRVIIWRFELISNSAGHNTPIQSLAYSHDGKLLAASHEELIEVWDVPHNTLKSVLTGHCNKVSSLAFSPLALMMASTGRDGAVFLWEFGPQVERTRLWSDDLPNYCVVFAPNGEFLVCGNNNASITVWNVNAHQLVCKLEGHRLAVRALDFGPSNNFLASGSDDGMLNVWRFDSNQVEFSQRVTQSFVCSARFSCCGSFLAAAGYDSSVVLLHLADWSMHTIQDRPANEACLSVEFSHCSSYLVAGTILGSVLVWAVNTHQRLRRMPMYAGSTRAIRFVPGANLVTTGGEDGILRVWKFRRILRSSLECHDHSQ